MVIIEIGTSLELGNRSSGFGSELCHSRAVKSKLVLSPMGANRWPLCPHANATYLTGYWANEAGFIKLEGLGPER